MSLISNAEIKKLRDYFDLNQVEYELRYWEEGSFNIHVNLEYIYLSFLTSLGSYGGIEGLIEFYNFRDEPTGYLTAGEAIEIYEKVVEEEQKYYIMDKDNRLLLYQFRCGEDKQPIRVVGNFTIEEVKQQNRTMPEITLSDYQFTEQEIKDYDDRFWSFAVPVEVAE